MRFSTISSLALTSIMGVSALALPPMTKRQAMDIDPVILQYALTLEHLENVFYKEALSKWDQQAFIDAGFTADFYDQLKYVAHDEEGHVLYLEAGLTAAGAMPVQACTYKFPMTDPKSFVALASVIEGVGVSAYLGAAADITEKAYLTAAGAILVTESIHQAAERNAIGEIPMANVFGTPMGMNAVYTIASGFIVSCPSTNMALPVMAYPSLTLIGGQPTSIVASVTLEPKTMPTGTFFATWVSGLDIVPVDVTVANGVVTAPVPSQAMGQSYVFLTSDNSGNVTDSNVLAGPTIVEVTPSSPTFNITIQ
ncbi:Protein rds1 [Lachnellula occidentalis]|uniref:Protein rds1 n=1 Tax=Lachnellula occidentalis TaxID=215460 RepID=A0A8H8S7M3_9HELO|nr:Protein rds1 [Lachnellula occidentalis]